jgi:hypothetical protein
MPIFICLSVLEEQFDLESVERDRCGYIISISTYTNSQIDSQPEGQRERGRQLEGQRGRQTAGQAGRQVGSQPYSRTARQPDSQTARQPDIQTVR